MPGRLPDDEEWAVDRVHQRPGGRSQQQAGEPAPTAAADDEQLRILGLLAQTMCGLVHDDDWADRHVRVFLGVADEVLRQLGCFVLDDLHPHGVAVLEGEGNIDVGPRVDGHEFGMPQCGFLECHRDGWFGVRRSVDADDDGSCKGVDVDVGRGADDGDGALCVGGDGRADRAQEYSLDDSLPVRTDDDHARSFRMLEKFTGGCLGAEDGVDLERVTGHCVGCDLGGLANLFLASSSSSSKKLGGRPTGNPYAPGANVVVITVRGAFRSAASFAAHDTACSADGDPSVPTTIGRSAAMLFPTFLAGGGTVGGLVLRSMVVAFGSEVHPRPCQSLHFRRCQRWTVVHIHRRAGRHVMELVVDPRGRR